MDSIEGRVLLAQTSEALSNELKAMAKEYMEYKARKDAYPGTVKKMENRIKVIDQFIQQVYYCFEAMDQERKAEYEEGYRLGFYEVSRVKDFHLRRDGWIEYALKELYP